MIRKYGPKDKWQLHSLKIELEEGAGSTQHPELAGWLCRSSAGPSPERWHSSAGPFTAGLTQLQEQTCSVNLQVDERYDASANSGHPLTPLPRASVRTEVLWDILWEIPVSSQKKDQTPGPFFSSQIKCPLQEAFPDQPISVSSSSQMLPALTIPSF